MIKFINEVIALQVKVNNLSFAYTQKFVLNKISFTLERGDFLTILGKNGSGKSTLVKCLLNLLKIPDETIYFNNVDINKMSTHYNIGYVPQNNNLNYEFPITVKEILTAAYNKRRDSYFSTVINGLDLNRFYYDNLNNLSGGQLQRVFIARALINKPRLLILDEPTTGVDIDSINNIKEILKELKEKKITIILVTHDKELTKDITDYYLELDDVKDYAFRSR